MGQITSLFARKMVAAVARDIDVKQALAMVGLDPDAPWNPREMISSDAYYDMLEGMAEQIDITALPVKVGASMRCDEYGALGLAWKAAPNLLGSFTRVQRYARLWTSVVSYELTEVPEGMLYLVRREAPRRLGVRLSNETTLVATVALSRQVSPVFFAPKKVFVQHKAPKSRQSHEDYFECPVEFGAKHDGLLLSKSSLEQANKLGDLGISQYLVTHLDADLTDLQDEGPLVTQVKDVIAQSLSEGVPKMADVARQLGFSVRSFHRRLSDHGVSFQTLTEETRRELAEGLLRDHGYSLAEVAFLTGFSEQSSFTRAFKRWVGLTPATYRRHRPKT